MKWQPTPVFLPGKSHRQSSLVGYSPCGHKESDMTERLSTHTHTRILTTLFQVRVDKGWMGISALNLTVEVDF